MTGQPVAYASNGRLVEVKRAADRAYYDRDRERIRATQAAYAAAHALQNRARARAWELADPQRSAIRKACRSATRKFGESVPVAVYAALMAQPCALCGLSPSGGVDHIVPFVQGGRNVVVNLQPCCLPCNLAKASRDRDGRP